MNKVVDETGKKYRRWTVIERAPSPKNSSWKGAWWLCECQCGNRRVIKGGSLREKRGTTSCGCYLVELCSKIKNNDAPYIMVMGKIKRSAVQLHRNRNYSFELTLADIKDLVTKDCFYCGCKPYMVDSQLSKLHNFRYNGLDRVDNSIGYVRTNVVPCCPKCNSGKMCQSQDEFFAWIDAVYLKRHSRQE